MCLIYNDDDERRRIIAKFLADGIAAGEQTGYFADGSSREEVRDWLEQAGAKLPEEDAGGCFEFYDAMQMYCPQGRFEPDGMLQRLDGYYGHARHGGYCGARVTGEMSWALRHAPGSERLIEYEAMINTLSETSPTTPICQYDARRFDGSTLLYVLKVHPLMIVHGQIVHNPYYIPPEQFFAKGRP